MHSTRIDWFDHYIKIPHIRVFLICFISLYVYRYFLTMSCLELHFKHPSTILLSGFTGCAITRFVRRILEERLIDPFPTRLIWVYSEWQDDYDKVKTTYPEIELMKGYSDDIYDSLEPSDRNLLILVDQMSEARDTKSFANRFSKGSYDRNITILYLVQHMFDQGKSSQTVSLNSLFTVLFRNIRDQSQFRTRARQIIPKPQSGL